jgi:PhnB protein
MNLNPYLHFNGQAEQALHFYAEVFDGDIGTISRFGESPMEIPDSQKALVMHAQLEFDGNTLMLSDSLHQAVTNGDNLSLSINLTQDEQTANRIFNALSNGGTVIMPLEKAFWGAVFGMTVDRFGIRWMVNCEFSD